MAGNLVPELHTHGLGNNEQYGVGNENRIDQQAKGVMPPRVFELQVGDAGDAASQSTAGTCSPKHQRNQHTVISNPSGGRKADSVSAISPQNAVSGVNRMSARL